MTWAAPPWTSDCYAWLGALPGDERIIARRHRRCSGTSTIVRDVANLRRSRAVTAGLPPSLDPDGDEHLSPSVRSAHRRNGSAARRAVCVLDDLRVDAEALIKKRAGDRDASARIAMSGARYRRDCQRRAVSQGRYRVMAERVGFEPTVEFPLHTRSRRAP